MVIQTYRVDITLDLIFSIIDKMTKEIALSLAMVAISVEKTHRLGLGLIKYSKARFNVFSPSR